MIDVLNDPNSIGIILYFVCFGLLAWFMGWGVSFLTSLFIKIIK